MDNDKDVAAEGEGAKNGVIAELELLLEPSKTSSKCAICWNRMLSWFIVFLVILTMTYSQGKGQLDRQ